ncbi:conserved phage C-terminal domain-containing protein [Desulfosporosinus metallidurans]|uniref:Uncharacterized protein n=1 Tax=Desulfosporosinus metallidurans TaxID=1888891 RepID=A0A1Q8QFJ3_9FIRM|nr:conserved phage C-terminal domain-containing protein [Desulfosporosinus metallidurans]OLN26117.1 hypothetical protein DSOL_5121 [Desulfosporosinus metallidurans]
MAGMISFRLGSEYLERLDALTLRLGVNRAQLIRNLLSGDSILIDMITLKAKTLNQVTLDEAIAHSNKNFESQPDLITVRLDSQLVQRFDELSKSLGINRVQLLRNLLSGDSTLVDAIAMKSKVLGQCNEKSNANKQARAEETAKSQFGVPPSSTPIEDARNEHISKQSNIVQGGDENFQEEIKPLSVLQEVAEQPSAKSKRGRKKSEPYNKDDVHLDARRLIIDYLNLKTNKNFKYTTKESIASLNRMLDEGRSVDDFKRIIDNMVAVWIDNPTMNVHLNPVTLFRPSHFENYLYNNGANLQAEGSKKTRGSNTSKSKTDDKYEKFYL